MYVALTDSSRLSLPVVSFARRNRADDSFSASRTKDEMFGAIVYHQPGLVSWLVVRETHLSTLQNLLTGRLSLGAIRLHHPDSRPQSLLGVLLYHQRHDLAKQVMNLLVRVPYPRDNLREGREELVSGEVIARPVDQFGDLDKVCRCRGSSTSATPSSRYQAPLTSLQPPFRQGQARA